MKNQNTKLTQDELIARMEEVTEIFRSISVNVLMNSYTFENVALGKLRPKEIIPFDDYVVDLELQSLRPYACRNNMLEGAAISNDEHVVDKDWDFFAKECYVHNMNFVFATAPHKDEFDYSGLLVYRHGLSEFIMNIYPVYAEILHTEVNCGFFDLAPIFSDKPQESECYKKIARFLVAMKMRKLRQGSCVDRYVKELPYIPYFVQRLLRKYKNRYLLANSDTNSLEYKLAVLSAIQFMNSENIALFELKAKHWYENNIDF